MQEFLNCLTKEIIVAGLIIGGIIGSLIGLEGSILTFYGLAAIAVAILNIKSND